MFAERSQEKELMDLGPEYYNLNEYKDCLRKLFKVNKIFGFFYSTVKTLNFFSKESSVLDVGCGGGLFLLHLSQYYPHMQLRGMDISAIAIEEAQLALQSWQKINPNTHVSFQLQEQTQLKLEKNSVDVILLTLVCHHIENHDLVIFLQKACAASRKAVIINELHRHRLAYWLYGITSPLLFKNKMITYDGLISIKRGFTRVEWQQLLQKAGIKNYQLKWCFPFRWKLILWK
jgi:2-polyprenyl-3-methyl-5-hydroxy-6-metoxy-1,4-benzoquinol methylase